jgi:hypothetical protein
MYGDKLGKSVIIEGDAQVPIKGRFQVMTNFFQSHPELGGYPCKRFEIANRMLEQSPNVSVDSFRRILAAVHLDHEFGMFNPTVYSNIYDLKQGIVHVYHYHNFENVVTINLAEELAKGKHTYDLPALFPETMAPHVYESSKSGGTLTLLLRILGEEGISATIRLGVLLFLPLLVVLLSLYLLYVLCFRFLRRRTSPEK